MRKCECLLAIFAVCVFEYAIATTIIVALSVYFV
eukprot:COSAG02_NODE_799_length_17084_cov_9.741242_18_plen_34_part_00